MADRLAQHCCLLIKEKNHLLFQLMLTGMSFESSQYLQSPPSQIIQIRWHLIPSILFHLCSPSPKLFPHSACSRAAKGMVSKTKCIYNLPETVITGKGGHFFSVV
jgi:hypothetical protein